MRRRVAFLFPTIWDARQYENCSAAFRARVEPVFVDPSDDACRYDLDPDAYVQRVAAELGPALDGVFSASDEPGAALVALVAARLGLPGPDLVPVLRCGHKFEARRVHRAAAPDCTPRFRLLEPDAPELDGLAYPCFVKPVKGSFSRLAQRVANEDELRAFLRLDAVRAHGAYFAAIFNKLCARTEGLVGDGRHFLAEDLAHGEQVTIEGFVERGGVTFLGVTDSVRDAATGSFLRFEYPSRLPARVVARMEDALERVVAATGLDRVVFNAEFLFDAARDALTLVEVNPRIAGQFGDLHEKVDGVNSYEIALAIALGETPRFTPRAGRFACAASVPLRIFAGATVTRVPDASRIRALEAARPGTLVFLECAAGDRLEVGPDHEDGRSRRYALVHAGADSPEELARAIDESVAALDLGLLEDPAAQDPDLPV